MVDKNEDEPLEVISDEEMLMKLVDRVDKFYDYIKGGKTGMLKLRWSTH